jgi:hypothetical protein
MARGLTFTHETIAKVSGITIPRVGNIRHRLGFTVAGTHPRSTLGEAVAVVLVARAQLRTSSALGVAMRHIAHAIDTNGAPVPEWVHHNGVTMAHVPTVIGHLVERSNDAGT